MPTSERTWIEISSAALRRNLRTIQRLAGTDVGVMPIVKANAYGHGLREVLASLRRQPHWGIGVAYGEEALLARSLNYRGRIVVLSNWQVQDLSALIKQRVELVVWDKDSLQAVLRTAKRSVIQSKIHLKLDTGTTRIGFLESDISMVDRLLKQTSLKVVGIFSHFANAEEFASTTTKRQLKRFTTLVSKLGHNAQNRGILLHIACTAAIIRFPEARFRLLRLGLGLYGLWPSDENKAWSRANLPRLTLRPVLQWYTHLAQVKQVPAGTAVGYGSTYRTRKPTRIGILPIGYADGYDRRLSNRGWVIINGRRAPVIGRVCMNLTMVDVTNVSGARTGQRVTLIGSGITADDMAASIGSINYEVTTRLNWSIPRLLI